MHFQHSARLWRDFPALVPAVQAPAEPGFTFGASAQAMLVLAVSGPGNQAFRQRTQRPAWLAATTRHPTGACGQLACAGWSAGHGISTTVTPAGGRLAGLKNWSFVQETWYASGTWACQRTSEATATCSPGRTPLALTGTFTDCAYTVPAREIWLVIWVKATRLTAATQARRPGRRPASGARRG